MEGRYELLLGMKKLRRKLLLGATGNVLEVAVGTGENLPFYNGDCQLTAIDMSEAMLDRAKTRAKKIGLNAKFLSMDAEILSFPEDSFDTVVSSLSMCTFPDPIGVLNEMARVCRPNGRILLLEHGRSSVEFLARWMDRRAERHAERAGCHWNREPLELVQQAGLRIVETQRTFFGVMHMINAEC
jgi:ubiquinone/menaquinone biosynthesis C-methylase UbiE